MQGHPFTEFAGGRASVLAARPFGAPAITAVVTAPWQGRLRSAKALDGDGLRSPGRASTCLGGGYATRKAWRPGEVNGGPVHGTSTHQTGLAAGCAPVSTSERRRPEGAGSASRHYVKTCPFIHSASLRTCCPCAVQTRPAWAPEMPPESNARK